MHRFRTVVFFIACLTLGMSGFAQAAGEDSEPTPEQIDAAFTSEDAAREAARWSKTIRQRDERSALERLSEEADLIFHGTVHSQEVHYRGNDIPFTHTRFAISDLVKGEVDGGFFTLVQEGGPDRLDPQKVLLVSKSEYFARDEEELLFIAFDAATGSHMVRERFRIMEGLAIFPIIYVMTSGGPAGSTETTNYYAFITGFEFLKVGYASSIILTFLAILVVILAPWTRLVLKNVGEK